MTLRPYSPPTITDLGSLATLTRGSNTGNHFDYGPHAPIPPGQLPVPNNANFAS
jgi:hypothetical protein